jgi:predicted DNA-binding transcriptional regulator AlpA
MYAQTGIQRETIYHWEHADRTPKITQLLWLCKCTGWKLSEIIGGGKNGG